MSNSASARDIARSIINEIAPSEASAFDYLWEKYQQDQRALDPEPAGRPAHGMGAAEVTLLSLIVIPIVHTVVGEGAKYGIKYLVEKIKERRARLAAGDKTTAAHTDTTEEDEKLAATMERKLNEGTGANTP